MDAVLPDPATPFGARVAHRLRATSPEEQLCYMHGGGWSRHAEATRARSSGYLSPNRREPSRWR